MRKHLWLMVLCLGCWPALAAEPAVNPSKMAGSRLQLGASAAFDPHGRLWAVYRNEGHVVLRVSDDAGQTWQAEQPVNGAAEAISADGENRPKIAFASDGGVLVSWTRPLSAPFSGEIRLARSADGGQRFAAPITVHRDRAEITHRFESLATGPQGLVAVAWIDKRDLLAARGKSAYRGAAIYAALSHDGGQTFAPERKVADHSCECCRIALTIDRDGAPLILWRQVFEPNVRDHAMARLRPDGSVEAMRRATFDGWKIDACPHHGPSLAVDSKGVQHAVWFNQRAGQAQVSYGQLPGLTGETVRAQRPVGSPRAAHADLGVADSHVLIAWKEFDGERTRLLAQWSDDGGERFSAPEELAGSAGATDQPRIIGRGSDLFVFWRTQQEGLRVFSAGSGRLANSATGSGR